ncbi:MAG: mandelate racemase/muconate lactonizing enzyme family protein [Acidobacteriota bacterium]
MNRRHFLSAPVLAAAGAHSMMGASTRELMDQLGKIAAKPVLKLDGLNSPVMIDSIRLLKKGKDHFVHVRSKDGAEGLSLPQTGRADTFAPILKQNIIKFFIGRDARNFEPDLWELYRAGDNYKLYGLAFWSAQAWVECAVLDMLGRMVKKPIGSLIGDVRRKEIPIYVASGRRDTTPPQEIEYLQKLVAESGARACKFRVGGRMSRNADASPNRTETLIPLVRKTFGDNFDMHADSNSSYDVKNAVRVGRLLEEVKAVYFEEPCEFDHWEEMKEVTDTLTIPIAAGEQEYSEWRFRWAIANHMVDIVQPDIQYYGGLIRSMRVARMADAVNMPTTVHISGGFGFVYMLHFASVIRDPGKYQEYKMGHQEYGRWFDGGITVKDGKMSVPQGHGCGIANIADVIKGAVEV